MKTQAKKSFALKISKAEHLNFTCKLGHVMTSAKYRVDNKAEEGGACSGLLRPEQEFGQDFPSPRLQVRNRYYNFILYAQ